KKLLCALLYISAGMLELHAQSSAPTATIWFYRAASSRDAGQLATIYSNNMPTRRLAILRPGEFFGLAVPPGVHMFSYTQAPARGQSVVVAINSGQQAYVEVAPDNIAMAETDHALPMIQRSQAINPANALDRDVIVPAASPASLSSASLTPPEGISRPLP